MVNLTAKAPSDCKVLQPQFLQHKRWREILSKEILEQPRLLSWKLSQLELTTLLSIQRKVTINSKLSRIVNTRYQRCTI